MNNFSTNEDGKEPNLEMGNFIKYLYLSSGIVSFLLINFTLFFYFVYKYLRYFQIFSYAIHRRKGNSITFVFLILGVFQSLMLVTSAVYLYDLK